MEQTITQVIATIRQTNNSSPTPSTSLQQCSESAKAVKRRFGEAHDFKIKVSPDAQAWAGKNPEKAVSANFPTLAQIEQAYGDGFPAEWLAPHVANLSLHTGAKNISVGQVRELSLIIAAEYHFLKITEILLFFHRFKAGHYGHFYGSADPMVVTCALREFLKDRADLIARHEQEQRERSEAEHRKRTTTWEYYSQRTYGHIRPNPLTLQKQ